MSDTNTSLLLGVLIGFILCVCIEQLWKAGKAIRAQQQLAANELHSTTSAVRSIDQDQARMRRDIEYLEERLKRHDHYSLDHGKMLYATTRQLNTVIDALKAAQLWPISNDSSSSKTTSSVPASPSSSGSAPTPTS